MLIEIEGIDGAGKTTQCNLLHDWFIEKKIDSLVVKEPGGTDFGNEIKKILISETPRDKKSEMFAFLLSKTQLYSQIISSQMASGKHIISDRGHGSFLSYHSITTGLGIKVLSFLLDIATNNTKPSLVILIDTPIDIASERNKEKREKSKFDNMTKGFFERQKQVLLNLSEASSNWVVIDGSLGIDEVQKKIRDTSSIFIKPE